MSRATCRHRPVAHSLEPRSRRTPAASARSAWRTSHAPARLASSALAQIETFGKQTESEAAVGGRARETTLALQRRNAGLSPRRDRRSPEAPSISRESNSNAFSRTRGPKSAHADDVRRGVPREARADRRRGVKERDCTSCSASSRPQSSGGVQRWIFQRMWSSGSMPGSPDRSHFPRSYFSLLLRPTGLSTVRSCESTEYSVNG